MKHGDGDGQIPLLLPERGEGHDLKRGFVVRLREFFGIQCPTCKKATVPFGAPMCPACGAPPTLKSALDATFIPVRERMEHRALRASKTAKRRIQWAYFILSGSLLWFLLPLVEGLYASQALSVVYVGVLGLFVVWLSPRRWRVAFFVEASPVIKFAISLNFFSALILLQLFIGAHWGRATTLATLFIVAWVGAFLLHCYILPMFALTIDSLLGQAAPEPDINQGRRVRVDP